MVRSYIKVATRNILKKKMYSFINAVGLSIGIAFCMLIYLFTQDERSFDQFHANKDNLYRIDTRVFNGELEERYESHAWLQPGLRDALLAEVPEVVRASRFSPSYTTILRYGDKVFTEDLTFVDNDFFTMFSFPLLSGNADKILKNNYEVVLTPSVVTKYFGDEDPLGKTIMLDLRGEKSFTVAGIITEPPPNSSLSFKILVSSSARPGYEESIDKWGHWSTPLFVELNAGTDAEKFTANMNKAILPRLEGQINQARKEASVPIPDDVKVYEYRSTSIKDVHLKKEVGWDKVSDPQYSLILSGLAGLILLIACINYISLALTTSASRRTEVGIRKVVGAQKTQLIYQFGFESILLALISLLLGIGMLVLFLPAFNTFTGKNIELTLNNSGDLLLWGLLAALLVGLLAGSYPAWFLSGFRPALVLKGRFTSKLQAGFTKPLVVLQFGLAAFLIISSLIMYRQMKYITTKDLGFDKDLVLVVPMKVGWNERSDEMVEQYRARLQQERSIISVAGVSNTFNRGISRYGYLIDGEYKAAYVYGVDPYYTDLMGMDLVLGRNFDLNIPSDSNSIIVNEALVRDMKWKDPLNEHLNWREDTVGLGSKVIGVVKDYHFQSLESDIEPMFMSIDTKRVGYKVIMLVKMAAGDFPATINALKKAWNEVSPDLPFEYTFMDEDVARQYETHERWMNIMGFSTAFAILISCLGLFGLSGVNAINRTKEIGIRKVMGAALLNIFVLLNRQYVWLALLAFLFAAPASWYIMNKWLSNFKFSVEIGWELFALSMGAGVLISIATVSYHAIRTALLNPADTLKHE